MADQPRNLNEAQFRYFRDAGFQMELQKKKLEQDCLLNEAKIANIKLEKDMILARTDKYKWQSKLFELQHNR